MGQWYIDAKTAYLKIAIPHPTSSATFAVGVMKRQGMCNVRNVGSAGIVLMVWHNWDNAPKSAIFAKAVGRMFGATTHPLSTSRAKWLIRTNAAIFSLFFKGKISHNMAVKKRARVDSHLSIMGNYWENLFG